MSICPFATVKTINGAVGSYSGGPYKIVHHTTEGPTAQSAFNTYATERSDPHFTVDETTVYQHVDTDKAARALANDPNAGVETNRDSAVQIELVGYAGRAKGRATLLNVARLCRWLEKEHAVPQDWPNGRPKPPTNGKDPRGHNRDANTWDTMGGHYGHSNVPENIHWDPAYTQAETDLIMAARFAGDGALLNPDDPAIKGFVESSKDEPFEVIKDHGAISSKPFSASGANEEKDIIGKYQGTIFPEVAESSSDKKSSLLFNGRIGTIYTSPTDTWTKIITLTGLERAELLSLNPHLESLNEIEPGIPIDVPVEARHRFVICTAAARARTAYQIAREELLLNVAEDRGKGKDHPRIRLYHSTTSGGAEPDEIPWCSSFVNFCTEHAGLRGTDSKAARSWLKWGSEVSQDDWIEGDVVVFKRAGSSWKGHVGFLVDWRGERPTVLGGNQRDRLSIDAPYPFSAILGVRREL